jgi:hypothetical protein
MVKARSRAGASVMGSGAQPDHPPGAGGTRSGPFALADARNPSTSLSQGIHAASSGEAQCTHERTTAAPLRTALQRPEESRYCWRICLSADRDNLGPCNNVAGYPTMTDCAPARSRGVWLALTGLFAVTVCRFRLSLDPALDRADRVHGRRLGAPSRAGRAPSGMRDLHLQQRDVFSIFTDSAQRETAEVFDLLRI